MPQAQTVDLPKRLPLVLMPENRDSSTTKDAKLVNCYSERTLDGSYSIYKRPGLLQSSQPSGGAASGFGMYNWLGAVYSIFGATMYKDGTPVTGTLDTTNGLYKFSSTLGATPKLVFGNGTASYSYNTGSGILAISGANFPAPAVKGWGYLDGWVFVMDADANIHGCDVINTPDTWTDTLNKLVAQIEPDAGVSLEKQLVYVVAFKQWSTEIFYDAGNATGSPLGAVQGAKINYGCVTSDSIVSIDGLLFWVGANKSSAIQILKMEGLKAEIISTEPIERLLNNADFSTTWAMAFKNGSHRFYILTVKVANLTLVYDLDTKMWAQWTDTSGNYFPFVATTYDSGLLQLLQHESNGRIYVASDAYYTDNGDVITIDLVTPNFDGGTNRGKQMNVMKFIADQVPGSVLWVRKNDNDYAVDKWSNFRRVDLSARQPMLTNCGSFVRRAHHFRHQSQTAFRMKEVELQMDLCVL